MTGRSWSPVTSGGVNAPLPSGLRLTTCRWFNRQRRTQSRDIKGERFYGWKWSKVLAHYGHFDQFAYGTDTGVTEEWMKDHRKERHQVQRGTACSIWSRVLMIDVDHEDRFLDTRTAQLVGRQHAFTVRCEGRYHIAIDGRAVPDADWPTQGPIAGADIKSHGFVLWPGSMHYSGD